MWWEGDIAWNTEGLVGEVGGANILQEGERGSTDLCCPHYAMQGLAAGLRRT